MQTLDVDRAPLHHIPRGCCFCGPCPRRTVHDNALISYLTVPVPASWRVRGARQWYHSILWSPKLLILDQGHVGTMGLLRFDSDGRRQAMEGRADSQGLGPVRVQLLFAQALLREGALTGIIGAYLVGAIKDEDLTETLEEVTQGLDPSCATALERLQAGVTTLVMHVLLRVFETWNDRIGRIRGSARGLDIWQRPCFLGVSGVWASSAISRAQDKSSWSTPVQTFEERSIWLPWMAVPAQGSSMVHDAIILRWL
ncbi:hypothetical protein VTO73DRAFT_5077 [Trametes versicolor]